MLVSDKRPLPEISSCAALREGCLLSLVVGYRLKRSSAASNNYGSPWLKQLSVRGCRTAFAMLNFLLQFAPTVSQEAALRAKLARIGITPGQPYDYGKLPEWDKLAQGLGIKHGFEEIQNYDARLS